MRIALALCLVAAPAHAGPCKFHHDTGFLPSVLTPEGATLDQHGGIVVAAESVRLDRAVQGDPSVQDWRFSDGRHDEVGKLVVIAPGLVVSAPTVFADDLVFENVDRSAARKVHYHAAKKDPVTLAAPKVTSVTYRDHGLPLMLRAETRATLTAAPPANVVAIVVYVDNKPRSWAAISDASSLDIAIWSDDDCIRALPGAISTRKGDRVTLAWLDATGHLSARTPTIVVQ